MIKFTNKQLKEIAGLDWTVDLNKIPHDWKPGESLTQVGYALGTYGIIGKMWRGNDSGAIYVAYSYNSNLYRF